MKSKKNNFSDKIWTILGLVIIIFAVYKFGYAFFNNHLVDDKATHTKAIIVNEKNVSPNQGHLGNDFTYMYEFSVNGKKYKGDSHDPSLKVGDTIEVKYYKYCPYFNKPMHPKD